MPVTLLATQQRAALDAFFARHRLDSPATTRLPLRSVREGVDTGSSILAELQTIHGIGIARPRPLALRYRCGAAPSAALLGAGRGR